jgi:uncharacterized protein YtpQ (UPF0354 family)
VSLAHLLSFVAVEETRANFEKSGWERVLLSMLPGSEFMAGISTNYQSNCNGLLCLLLVCLSASGCAGPVEEKAPPATVKIRLEQPPLPQIENTQKALPDIVFPEGLEAADLTDEQFTELYGKTIQTAAPRLRVTVTAPLLLAVRVDKQDQHDCKIDLHKIWLSCKDKPGQRSVLVAPLMKSFLGMINFVSAPLEGEEYVDKIVPILRNEQYLQALKERRATKGYYYEKAFGDLYLIYAVHDPQYLKMLDNDFLKNYAKTKKELLKTIATKNLERIVAEKIVLHADGPIYSVTVGDDYEPSLLLLDKAVHNLSDHVKGRLVAAIPDKSTLLICGDETPGALEKLREATNKAMMLAKQPISDKLFIYDQGQWKVFKAFDS